MYDATAKWLSWLPGGLMRTNIGSCALFAFPFTVASKITFIHLDFTTKHGFVFSFQLQSDNLA